MRDLNNLNYEEKADEKNEFAKTLSKDEIRLELARAKKLREQYKAQIEQYKAQKQIITEQERAKREQIRAKREQIISKRKEIELELLHQKEISKALKTKNFTEPIKQEIMSMLLELAKQAIQEEYTNKLKQLDDYGNIQYGY